MQRAPLPLIANYRPQAVLAWRGSEPVSQQQFLAAVARLSRRLPTTNFVINLCRDRYHFMVGFCAALVRDSVSLLPPNRQPDTVREIAAAYAGSICLVDGEADIDMQSLDVREPDAGGDSESLLPMVPAERLAAIAFTSGSTGTPMPNSKPWYTLCGTASMLEKRFVAGLEEATIVATVPSQHMYGLEMTVMMALQGNCAIASAHPFYAEDLCATLADVAAPRLLVTTPVHLRHLVAGSQQTPALSRIVSATAPLAPELAVAAEAMFGAEVEEIFGCTEAGSMATRRPVEVEDWQLLDGMGIVDDAGGIYVTGPQLAGETELQDRIEVLAPDRFRFIGRAADAINVGGKRASLADLTSKLQDLEGVVDGVVFMPVNGAERPAALVVSERSTHEIQRALAQRVDPVLLPRPLKKVERIPRNETGKPSAALLQAALEGHDDA